MSAYIVINIGDMENTTTRWISYAIIGVMKERMEFTKVPQFMRKQFITLMLIDTPVTPEHAWTYFCLTLMAMTCRREFYQFEQRMCQAYKLLIFWNCWNSWETTMLSVCRRNLLESITCNVLPLLLDSAEPDIDCLMNVTRELSEVTVKSQPYSLE